MRVVFLVLTAGKDSVQSPQSYFGGFFKQLTGKWIGTAAAGSLYGALTISRCGDSFLTTQGKVLWFNMNEEHKKYSSLFEAWKYLMDECKA